LNLTLIQSFSFFFDDFFGFCSGIVIVADTVSIGEAIGSKVGSSVLLSSKRRNGELSFIKGAIGSDEVKPNKSSKAEFIGFTTVSLTTVSVFIVSILPFGFDTSLLVKASPKPNKSAEVV